MMISLVRQLKLNNAVYAGIRGDPLASLNGIKFAYALPQARQAHSGYLHQFITLSWLTLRSIYVYARVRPSAVISCGPGIAVPISALACIFGKKAVYIESNSRVYNLSPTGTIMKRFASLFIVQWEPLAGNPSVVYGGLL